MMILRKGYGSQSFQLYTEDYTNTKHTHIQNNTEILKGLTARERRRFPSEAVREYDLRLARLSGRVRCFQAAATREKGWIQLDTKAGGARGWRCVWCVYGILYTTLDQVQSLAFLPKRPGDNNRVPCSDMEIGGSPNLWHTYIHTEEGGRCARVRVILFLSTNNLWLRLYQGHHRCLVTGKWDSPSAILPATPLPVLFREPHPTWFLVQTYHPPTL